MYTATYLSRSAVAKGHVQDAEEIMPHQLRFLFQSLPNVRLDKLLKRYRHIESLGFDLAAVPHHFVDWNHRRTLGWFEACTLLAAVAREKSGRRPG
jgi:hypothetical protein